MIDLQRRLIAQIIAPETTEDMLLAALQALNNPTAQISNTVELMVDRVLKQFSIPYDKNSPEYYHTRMITADFCKYLLASSSYRSHYIDKSSNTIANPGVIPNQRHIDEKPVFLGKMVKNYINENISLRRWADSTEKSASAAVKLLLEYFSPDTDMRGMTREQILEFREIIPRIPAYRNSRKEYKGKSLHELIALKNVETIKLNTQKNTMSYVIAFFAWCSSPLNKNCIENIAKGIDIPNDPHTASNAYKENFEIAELENMLRGLSELKTSSSKWDWRYWIPIVGMYTGMRLNEVCQLYLSDIIQKDNIAFIDINPYSAHNDKGVKNKSSIRLVPIHSTLLKLDFLGFVEDLREQESERLFPDLTYSRIQGYKRNMGRWFNEDFKKEYMSASKHKTFHSLRGNFLTQLNSSNPNHVIMQHLAGHARTNITDAVYITPTSLQLKDTIELLDYGVDVFALLGRIPISDERISTQIGLLPYQNHYSGG